MATTSLDFLITATDKASKVFEDIGRKVQTTEDKLKRAATIVNTGLAAAGAGVIAVGTMSIDAASDLEQSMGGMQSVFKGVEDQMASLADGAAQSVGLSKNEFANLSTVLGAQLKNMGTDMDELVPQTDSLVTMGADLAAQFGGSTSDAVGALSSLLRGERDPIERYGVSINEAAIKAKMAEMGLDGLSGEAEKNAKLQATLALLTDQTADATGAFARESDTLAGKQQRTSAQWENMQAQLGTKLLPVVTTMTGALSGLMTWVDKNRGMAIGLVAVVGALAIALNVAANWTTITTTAARVAAAAQWLWNAAMSANPIGLIIAGIAALVAGLVWFFTKTETGRRLWEAFTAALSDGWEWTKNAFKVGYEAVKNWLGKAWDFIKKVWSFSPIGLIVTNWDKIKGAFASGYETVKGWLQKAWDFVKKVWSFSPLGLIVTNWDKIVDFVKKMPGRISSAASGLWDGIKNSFKSAMNWLIDKWNNFGITLGGGKILGIDIPTITLNTPNIPRFFGGGTNPRTQVASVGEYGPERVILPAGARVMPAGRASNMGGGGVPEAYLDALADRIVAGMLAGAKRVAQGEVAAIARAAGMGVV